MLTEIYKKLRSSSGAIYRGALYMTVFSLINKLLGVFLRLFLSARIGGEGMGLYQLIMSVYTLFSTFATAGFTVSLSRLVAEKDEKSPSLAREMFYSSLAPAFLISFAATLIMFFCSGFIATTFLGDERCALPLKILSVSMPFMAISACFKGWFIAKGKVVITSSSSLFEQLVKLAVITVSLCAVLKNSSDIGRVCEGIVVGVTLSEMSSFTYLFIFKIASSRKEKYKKSEKISRKPLRRELFSVAVPISLSVYLSGILHTAETLLVPYVFEKYSGDRSKALTDFGTVRGMVIPLLFFPFAFLQSLVSVFTPEISKLHVAGDSLKLRAKISELMSVVSVFGIAAFGLFFFRSETVGEAFYPNCDTATPIKLLALVTPFMYSETVADGLLKALGEQKRTLLFTILNSALRVILILAVVSKSGAFGYLLLLIVSNTFSYILCRARLFRVSRVKPDIKLILLSLFSSALSGLLSGVVERALPFSASRVALASAVTVTYVGVFALTMLLFRGRLTVRKRAGDTA